MSTRLVAVTVMSILLIFGMAVGAHAKGPESSTLTGPGIDDSLNVFSQTGSGDTTDLAVDLLSQTGLWYGASGPAIETLPNDRGEPYILTWVNMGPPGDPIKERTIAQYIYLDATGGPLIHTPEQIGLDGWGGEVIGWFKAPAELPETLRELIAMSEPASPIWLVLAATIGAGGLLMTRQRAS